MILGLRYLEGRVAHRRPFSKRAELGMARRQVCRDEYRGKEFTPTRSARCLVETCCHRREALDRATIIPARLISDGQMQVRPEELVDGGVRRERRDACGSGDRLAVRAREVAMQRQRYGDFCQPTRI